MHDFGAMPAPLAALATLLFCAYLALFPAFAAYVSRRMGAIMAALPWMLPPRPHGRSPSGFAAGFSRCFPWLAIGYSQAPWSPLTGYAPLLGVYGFIVDYSPERRAAGHRFRKVTFFLPLPSRERG